MDEIGITKFTANCCAMVERVRRTRKPILVTRSGKPLARIVPVPVKREKRWIGAFKGSVTITDDIVSPAIDENDLDVLMPSGKIKPI